MCLGSPDCKCLCHRGYDYVVTFEEIAALESEDDLRKIGDDDLYTWTVDLSMPNIDPNKKKGPDGKGMIGITAELDFNGLYAYTLFHGLVIVSDTSTGERLYENELEGSGEGLFLQWFSAIENGYVAQYRGQPIIAYYPDGSERSRTSPESSITYFYSVFTRYKNCVYLTSPINPGAPQSLWRDGEWIEFSMTRPPHYFFYTTETFAGFRDGEFGDALCIADSCLYLSTLDGFAANEDYYIPPQFSNPGDTVSIFKYEITTSGPIEGVLVSTYEVNEANETLPRFIESGQNHCEMSVHYNSMGKFDLSTETFTPWGGESLRIHDRPVRCIGYTDDLIFWVNVGTPIPDYPTWAIFVTDMDGEIIERDYGYGIRMIMADYDVTFYRIDRKNKGSFPIIQGIRKHPETGIIAAITTAFSAALTRTKNFKKRPPSEQ